MKYKHEPKGRPASPECPGFATWHAVSKPDDTLQGLVHSLRAARYLQANFRPPAASLTRRQAPTGELKPPSGSAPPPTRGPRAKTRHQSASARQCPRQATPPQRHTMAARTGSRLKNHFPRLPSKMATSIASRRPNRRFMISRNPNHSRRLRAPKMNGHRRHCSTFQRGPRLSRPARNMNAHPRHRPPRRFGARHAALKPHKTSAGPSREGGRPPGGPGPICVTEGTPGVTWAKRVVTPRPGRTLHIDYNRTET